MKHLFLPALLLFNGPLLKAQFGPAIYIDTLQNETVSQIACGDFNNDSLPDILTSAFHWPLDSLRLYLNAGGNQFISQAIPGGALSNLESFDTGDLNNDGMLDFAISHGAVSEITWFENTGTSFLAHVVDTGLDVTAQLLLRDFNSDSRLDILSLQHLEIVLYLADTAGGFNPPQVIHGGTEFYAIDAADYNLDGSLDVSVASGGFEILLNNGAGAFTLHSQQGLGLCFGLQSADLDQDNDIDIAAYESLTGILFYSNNGSGNFALQDTILFSTDNFPIFSIDDVDCDTIPDIVTSIPQPGQVVWVKNNLAAGFSTPNVIHTQNGQLISVTAVYDMTADGNPDILWGNANLALHVNQCTPQYTQELNYGNILLYPNPAGSRIFIDFGNFNNGKMKLKVLNGPGQEVLNYNLASMQSPLSFDVSHLPPGIYFVMVTGEDLFQYAAKIVIAD